MGCLISLFLLVVCFACGALIGGMLGGGSGLMWLFGIGAVCLGIYYAFKGNK